MDGDFKMTTFRQRNGLTALITVLVLGSVALLTAIIIALRAAGEVDLGLTSLHGQQADVTLSGCAEEALIRLSRDQSFAQGASQSYDIGNGTCTFRTFLAPSSGFQTYGIELKAQRGRSEKCASMRVIVPSLQIAQWKTVACTFDFEQ